MGPKLERRSDARVKPSPKKTVTWAVQHPTPKRKPSRRPKGKDLQDAIEYMLKNDESFTSLPTAGDHGFNHLWSYVMYTKEVSEASKHVYDKYFALQRTKRVGEE